MAPGYRTATTTRRGNRSGYPEHDDFEGLPVRQWRLQEVDIAPPPVPATTQKNDRWSIELPHGMPKDFNLLPPHTQELLRAARSGALYKRKAPHDEEDALDISDSKLGTVPGLAPDAEKAGDRKGSTTSRSAPGIKVKVWKRVGREAEVPMQSYLAKRHKNTITLPSKGSASQFSGPTVTRVTVRRVDAAGNAYERTITINDDEQLKHLDGEIISTTVIAAPVAADPLAQQQATPTRKRPPPPPPRKKHKGPGRGRKKKLGLGPLPLPLKPGASANAAAAPDGAVEPKTEAATPAEGIKQEDTGTPDVEMGENSAIASDDDEGDDDEGDDGEDGEGNEDGTGNDGPGDDSIADVTELQTPDNRQDQEMEDADATPDAIQPSSIEEPSEDSRTADVDTEVITTQQPPSSLNSGAAHLGVSHLFSPRQHEGSPLKNVILQSPTEPKTMDFPSIASVQEVTSSASQDLLAPEGASQMTDTVQETSETTAPGLAAIEVSEQTTVVAPEGDTARGAASATFAVKKVEATHDSGAYAQTKTSVHTSSFSQQSYHSSSSSSLLPSLRDPPKGNTLLPAQPLMHTRPTAEDDGLDLLGGLERELDRQSRQSVTQPDGAAEEQSVPGEKSDVQE